MKITMTMGYGLMAAGYLAEHAEDGWIAGNTISEEYHIPLEFLLKIMQDMGKQNLISSKRGPGGGFRLARPAKEISLLEVIEATGGPMTHSGDLTQLTADTPLTRKLEAFCKNTSEKTVAVFSKANLGQMVGK